MPESFDSPNVVIETYQRAGVITGVDTDRNQANISLGLSDEVKIGQQLTVTSGDQTVGTVEVITVERDNCVAGFLDVPEDRPLRKGDRIQVPVNSATPPDVKSDEPETTPSL